jgi:hypothetical protein
MGFKVYGLGLRVRRLGSKVWFSGFTVQGVVLRYIYIGYRVQSSGFRVEGVNAVFRV